MTKGATSETRMYKRGEEGETRVFLRVGFFFRGAVANGSLNDKI